MTEQKRDGKLVKAAFELRLMAESGFLPELAVCGACQNPIEGTVYFSVREGVALDEQCLRRIGGGDFVALPQGTYAAMAHILTCETPRVFAFALEARRSNALPRCARHIRFIMPSGDFPVWNFIIRYFKSIWSINYE